MLYSYTLFYLCLSILLQKIICIIASEKILNSKKYISAEQQKLFTDLWYFTCSFCWLAVSPSCFLLVASIRNWNGIMVTVIALNEGWFCQLTPNIGGWCIRSVIFLWFSTLRDVNGKLQILRKPLSTRLALSPISELQVLFRHVSSQLFFRGERALTGVIRARQVVVQPLVASQISKRLPTPDALISSCHCIIF